MTVFGGPVFGVLPGEPHVSICVYVWWGKCAIFSWLHAPGPKGPWWLW